jgi:hypothetical protein
MLTFGLWWLSRAKASARNSGEGYGGEAELGSGTAADDQFIRERATSSHEFDPAEIRHGKQSAVPPPIGTATIPLIAVIGVNLLMSLLILLGLTSRSLRKSAGAGRRLPALLECGRSPSLSPSPPQLSSCSIEAVCRTCGAAWTPAPTPRCSPSSAWRAWLASVPLSPRSRPSRGCATGCCRYPADPSLACDRDKRPCRVDRLRLGRMTIALDALGDTYLHMAQTAGIHPALMHRIAVIGSGTLDSLPHNGAVVTLLAVCGSTHRKSYFDMVIVNIVGPLIALAVVITLGSMLGSI